MKTGVWMGLAMILAAGIFERPASAAALGFAGTGGWVIAGNIGNLTGLCGGAGCDSGLVPFTTGGLLADGMVISGNVRQIITDDGVNATSALLLVTDILATNSGEGLISDTMYIVSDQFSPSLPGPVGVGIIGAFLSNAGLGGNISFGSAQAQMNFLTTGLITQAGFGGPLTGFSLTTLAPTVSCVECSPIPFWAAAFGFDGAGGVEQLIGAINFTLGPGASIVLPGSLIIENNNNAIDSEIPEPGTLGTLTAAMIALVLGRKRIRG